MHNNNNTGEITLNGKIIKIHSDFYYVKSNDIIIECKVREILKKEHLDIFVGDDVLLEEYNPESNQAVITKVLDRHNYITRPAIANVDQIIVVTALKEPQMDFLQLNRYLCQAKIYNIPAIICVNKCDLIENEREIKEISKIYNPLDYELIFTSALKNSGIDALKNYLKEKTSVLCGASGVGKSSLLNSIEPGLALRTKEVSNKNARGTHTTRHTEIINLKFAGVPACVADTPGFSHLKFDNIMPDEVNNLFSDIAIYSNDCKYRNCLHYEEEGCNVIANLDKIEPSRYESYKSFLNESREYKELIKSQGYKEESSIKDNGKAKVVKLGTKAREKSRRKSKQNLNISTLEDAYYNNEDDLY